MKLSETDLYFTAEVNETAYDWLSVRILSAKLMEMDKITEPTLRFESGDTCYLHPKQVKELVEALQEWLKEATKA